jgi:hypothetical protein
MLEARHFSIFTNHKPIMYAFMQKRGKFSPGPFKHLTSSPNSRRTYGTYPERKTLSTTPCLQSSPSIGDHLTTHWPHHRTATTSSEHSWGQPPPCGSRSYRSPAPRSPSAAILLPGDLGPTLQLPCGSKFSGPSTICHTQATRQERSCLHSVCVARRREGLPHLGTCLPVQPTLQILPHYILSIGRIYPPLDPFCTYT